jgi:hypothetical protein
MSKLNQFNANTNEAVGVALASNVGNSQPTPKDGVPGNINTAQGGETISPAGATRESLSAPLQAIHGALVSGGEDPLFQNNIQSSSPGLTGGLDLPARLEDVRVGFSSYGSAENSVGKPEQSAATDQLYNIPTDTTTPNMVNNVGARFLR